jgi:hypothetical protein
MENSPDPIATDLTNEQRRVDEGRRAMARDIVTAQPLASLDEARQFAENWVVSAAQHAANETYWRERALAAEGRIKRLPEFIREGRVHLSVILQCELKDLALRAQDVGIALNKIEEVVDAVGS